MKTNIYKIPLKPYNAIPKRWKKNAANYPDSAPEVLYKDGWRDVIDPEGFDPKTQKRGAILYDGAADRATFQAINLTPEELEERAQATLDSDAAATELSQAIADGTQMFQRFFAYLQRRLANGQITVMEAKNVAQLLFLPLLPINYGQFQLARINLNGLTPPTNENELTILNLAKKQIADYINK